MRIPFNALQSAMFERISAADITVYDSVPYDPGFPYTTIGEVTGRSSGSKTSTGMDCSATVNVWSQYSGFKEANDIADSITDALTSAPLTVDGFQIIFVEVTHAATLLDEDGITRHLVLRYRYETRER